MTANHTLTELRKWCKTQTGDEQTWSNKGSTYFWNRGKDTASGLINGVVRKLAGVDATGSKIWVVAGSFKINEQGQIIRFTGIPRKVQKTFEPQQQTVDTDKELQAA